MRKKTSKKKSTATQHPLLTRTAMETFLSGGGLPSVTPAVGRRLAQTFGADAFSAIEESHPDAKRLLGASFDKAWDELTDRRKQSGLMSWLMERKMSGTMANKVWSWLSHETTLTPDAAKKLWEQDPYRLSMVPGFGFLKVDDFAIDGCGFAVSSKERSAAIARESIKKACDDAGGGAPYDQFVKICRQFAAGNGRLDFKAATAMAADSVALAIESGIACKAKDSNQVESLFGNDFLSDEETIAKHLILRKQAASGRIGDPAAEAGYAALNEDQKQAVDLIASEGTVIVCGRPGTGKTTLLKSVAPLLAQLDGPVFYAAPTGMAAKRMSKAIGKKASTIHSLLGLRPDDDDSAAVPTLAQAAAVVVDECSMLDAKIMAKLLASVKPETRLIFLGDPDQLPSIGAGAILRDLIESKFIPVSKLTKIMRQAEGSNISDVADLISKGEVPEFNDGAQDCVYREEADAGEVARRMTQMILTGASKKYDIRKDIHVLCAGKGGAGGSDALNRMLQQQLNAPAKGKRQIQLGDTLLLREQDKAMHTSNDYERAVLKPDGTSEKGVFNGQMGVIKSIDATKDMIVMETDDGEISYSFKDAKRALTLAWASTIHKFQGSEAPVVFLVANEASTPFFLRNRNLIYTGLTRARSKCVVFGQKAILRQSAKTDALAKRKTRLKGLLSGGLEFTKPQSADVLALSEEMIIQAALAESQPAARPKRSASL